MTGSPHAHTGLLVYDLLQAAARLEEVLGLTFGPVRSFDLSSSTVDGLPGHGALRYTFSTQGPPYLELIEACDDGPWGRQHGEGLHHIGIVEPDFDRALARAIASGTTPQAALRVDGKLRAVYLPRSAAHGIRIELVHPWAGRDSDARHRA